MNQINGRAGCKAVCTTRRQAEGYLHGHAISEAYAANGLNVVFPEVFDPSDDVPTIVAKTNYENASGEGSWDALDPEDQSKRSSKVKRFLNTQAMDRMTLERLDQVDPGGEVRSWFTDMVELMGELE